LVESKEGVGSTFLLYGPIPALGHHAPLETAQKRSMKFPSSPSILVAEDNAVSDCWSGGLLAKQGHTVTEARTGRDAFTLCEEGTFRP